MHIHEQSKKNIYLITETAHRELFANTLLSLEMISRGYRVYIISQKAMYTYLKRLEIGIILDKGWGKPHEIFFKEATSLGHKIIILRSEPIAYNRYLFKHNYGRQSFESLKSVYKILSLGNEYYKDLIKIGINQNKIQITGNPRFNLLSSNQLDLAYGTRVKKIKNEYRDFVLIVSNFPQYSRYIIRDSDGSFKSKRVFVENPSENYSNEVLSEKLIDFRVNIFANFLNLIEQLLISFPSKVVIYRPHPSENPSKIKKYFSKYNNFKLIYRYSAIEWILASDISISNDCTTIVESYLAGKTSISFRPIKSKRFENEETINLSHSLYSTNELVHYINEKENYNALAFDKIIATETMDRYISFNKNYESIIKITDVFDELSVTTTQKIRKRNFFNKLIMKTFFNTIRFYKRFLYSDMTINQVNGFNLANTRKYLENSKKLLNSKVNYELEEVLSEVYQINVNN